MLALTFLTILAWAGQLTFPTAAPELSKGGGYAFPMNDTDYRAFAERLRSMGNRGISVRTKPPGLSPNATFGYNFVVGGKNCGWVLDGDDVAGWVLYLDRKGDGDLSAAKPEKFERVDGAWQLLVQVDEDGRQWPCRFEVSRIKVEGEEKLGVKISTTTLRRGVIEIDGKRTSFTLRGTSGKYTGPNDSIVIEGDESPYKVSDGRFNLFGKSYEFVVDPDGNSLTLTALAESIPDRPSLKNGATAPAFSAADLDGHRVDLANYKGRMLLVEFWATSCAPCRAEAPRMVEFYRTLAHDKIEFLGVSSDESESTLRKFLGEFAINWPQIQEPFEGPIHKLYRVAGEPTYILVGAGGEILDTWVGSGQTNTRVAKFLDAR
ncbi:MAG TPA: TlpA disulfide reductase family protein [Bryobacteraceae bacterium]|jgi:peroxiredoxin|nr:TlpA disulfide reductase family protein [Bryobacteraceae bacterium]